MRIQNKIAIISIVFSIIILIGWQNVKAMISIDEDNVKRIGVEYANLCSQALAMKDIQGLRETGQTAMTLAQCDNDMLIYKVDICPNHNYKFPVCHEKALFSYIVERGLDSITVAPVNWWKATHPVD